MVKLNESEEVAVAKVLATTSDWALGHVRQVERVASWLYDALLPFHGLGDDERTLLRVAALLHDVGYPVDPPRHHKVSGRIIRAHLGQPFSPGQVELIALLARYHRKAPPKLGHDRYRALDERGRRVVVWLGGILRVADGLDRPHDSGVQFLAASIVEEMIEVQVGRQPWRARIGATNGQTLAIPFAEANDGSIATSRALTDLETNVVGAMRKRDLLERALGRPVIVRAI